MQTADSQNGKTLKSREGGVSMQTLKASGGDLGGGTENLVIMTCAKQSIYEYVESEKTACLQATNFIAGGGGMRH